MGICSIQSQDFACQNKWKKCIWSSFLLDDFFSDANDDIETYKRRLKIMSDQMEQLRDQITKVEGAIAKEQLERQRIETERNTLRSELTLLKEKTLDIERKLMDVETEQVKLVRIIKHADHEKEQMLKEVQRITRERDILGTQVIRRNDELTLLSEKLRILELIMEKGERAYKARLDDIRVLKLELQVSKIWRRFRPFKWEKYRHLNIVKRSKNNLIFG